MGITALEFHKLRTLILVDSPTRTQSIVLTIVKASNLTELGMVDMRSIRNCEDNVAKKFFELVKCNLKLKSLHMPDFAAEMFLEYALENPQVGIVSRD